MLAIQRAPTGSAASQRRSTDSCRTGANDADFLVKQFSPTFDVDDLVRLPNFHAITRIMANNIPSQPFSMAMLPKLL